jgi:hypothetical protein
MVDEASILDFAQGPKKVRNDPGLIHRGLAPDGAVLHFLAE